MLLSKMLVDLHRVFLLDVKDADESIRYWVHIAWPAVEHAAVAKPRDELLATAGALRPKSVDESDPMFDLFAMLAERSMTAFSLIWFCGRLLF